jgi:hypothetical protein
MMEHCSVLLTRLQRDLDGHNYYEFEFTVSNSRYTRHQLAVVAAANGKLNAALLSQPATSIQVHS